MEENFNGYDWIDINLLYKNIVDECNLVKNYKFSVISDVTGYLYVKPDFIINRLKKNHPTQSKEIMNATSKKASTYRFINAIVNLIHCELGCIAYELTGNNYFYSHFRLIEDNNIKRNYVVYIPIKVLKKEVLIMEKNKSEYLKKISMIVPLPKANLKINRTLISALIQKRSFYNEELRTAIGILSKEHKNPREFIDTIDINGMHKIYNIIDKLSNYDLPIINSLIKNIKIMFGIEKDYFKDINLDSIKKSTIALPFRSILSNANVALAYYNNEDLVVLISSSGEIQSYKIKDKIYDIKELEKVNLVKVKIEEINDFIKKTQDYDFQKEDNKIVNFIRTPLLDINVCNIIKDVVYEEKNNILKRIAEQKIDMVQKMYLKLTNALRGKNKIKIYCKGSYYSKKTRHYGGMAFVFENENENVFFTIMIPLGRKIYGSGVSEDIATKQSTVLANFCCISGIHPENITINSDYKSIYNISFFQYHLIDIEDNKANKLAKNASQITWYPFVLSSKTIEEIEIRFQAIKTISGNR